MQFCYNGIRNCKTKLENHVDIEKKNLNAEQSQNTKTGPLSTENSNDDFAKELRSYLVSRCYCSE